MAACPSLATDQRYLGPMPLAAAQRYNEDTRDNGRSNRNQRGDQSVHVSIGGFENTAMVFVTVGEHRP